MSPSEKECKAFIASQDAEKITKIVEKSDKANSDKTTKKRSSFQHIVDLFTSIRRESVYGVSSQLIGLRVLLINDDVVISQKKADWLRKSGCIVTIANNDEKGLHYMITEEFDVCLVNFLVVSEFKVILFIYSTICLICV